MTFSETLGIFFLPGLFQAWKITIYKLVQVFHERVNPALNTEDYFEKTCHATNGNRDAIPDTSRADARGELRVPTERQRFISYQTQQ